MHTTGTTATISSVPKAANNEAYTMAGAQPLTTIPNVCTTWGTCSDIQPMTQKTARKVVRTTISLTGNATTNAVLMCVTTTGRLIYMR